MFSRTIARSVLLVAGAAMIIAAAVYVLSHMDDRAVFTVLVPGVVFGLILIGVSVRVGPTSKTR